MFNKISKISSDIYLIKTFLYSNATAMQKMSNESNEVSKICKWHTAAGKLLE